MGNIVREKLSEKKRARLTKGTERLAEKLAGIRYELPVRVAAMTRIKFLFCRSMQKSLHKNATAP